MIAMINKDNHDHHDNRDKHVIMLPSDKHGPRVPGWSRESMGTGRVAEGGRIQKDPCSMWASWEKGPLVVGCLGYVWDCTTQLGGGFKYVVFSPSLGKIPILTNIFQMVWNHRLASYVGIIMKIHQTNPKHELISSCSTVAARFLSSIPATEIDHWIF